MNGGFLNKNVLKNSTVSINGEVNTVLTNLIPADMYRADVCSLAIDIELPEERGYCAFAVINTNITSACLKFLSDTGQQAGEISLNGRIEDMGGYSNLYITFAETSYKHLRLECSAPEPVEAGEFFLGSVSVFDRNFKWGYSPYFKVNKSYEVVNGQFLSSDDSYTEQNGWKLDFEAMPEHQTEMFRDFLRERQLVFVPDFSAKKCYFGNIVSDQVSFQTHEHGSSASVEFMESGICTG